MNVFADNLTYLRKQKLKLTQVEVAKVIGVNVKRYQAWEEGRALPRQAVMPKICQAFEMYDIYKLLHERIHLSNSTL